MTRLRNYYLLHPFFFSTYPILFLFSNNLGKTDLSQLFTPLVLVLFSSLIISNLFRLLFKNPQKAALLSSVWVLLFFSFGHVYNIITTWSGELSPENYTLMFAVWIIFFSFSYFLTLDTKKDVTTFNRTLFNISFVLLFLQIATILSFLLSKDGGYFFSNTKTVFEYNKGKNFMETPDVYYIILDRYARSDVLKRFYNFDNSEFLDFLRKNGFYVSDKSSANYLKTTHSLASSLSMNYLEQLKNQEGVKSRNWKPLYKMLTDYPVWKILKEHNYQFFHFGTWWEPTSRNPYADVNFNKSYFSEFSSSLYKTTFLNPVGIYFGFFDERLIQWERERYKLSEIKKIPDIKEPTFVFAHFLVPHPPYVFSESGEYVTTYQGQTGESLYLGQVKFINYEVEKTVQEILAKSPDSIIIIQSDEGPHPKAYEKNETMFNWETASDDELSLKMNILNAYHFPKHSEKPLLYPEISPVNSFRVFFDLYFETNYGLLEDKSYIYQDNQHPYKFIDTTNKLQLINSEK